MRALIAFAFLICLSTSASAAKKNASRESDAFEESALQNEAKGHYDAAMRQLRMAIRLDRRDPEPFLQASRVRLKMGDAPRSHGNLRYAILRSRANGDFSAFSERVKSDPDFEPVLAVQENARLLELYDQVQAGRLSERQAQAGIQEPGELRDALVGLAGPGALRSLTPLPAVRSMAKPLPPAPVCVENGCSKERMESALSRADAAFDAQRYDEAAGFYELALTIGDLGPGMTRPERGRVFERIGVSLRRLGLVQESLTPLKAAARYRPESTKAAYELAATYSRLGDDKRSARELKRLFKAAEAIHGLDGVIVKVEGDADFDMVRRSKRYAELVAQFRK